MAKAKNELGNKYGRLTVVEPVGIERTHMTWQCVCDCGKTTTVRGAQLRNGNTKSCGCFNLDRIRQRSTTHGLTGTLAYTMFSAAKARARKEGLSFDLSPKDIVIPTHCPILGIKLKGNKVFSAFDSPSLDRIIPSRGYVKGNIWVISFRANTLKSDASLQELKQLVAAWTRVMGASGARAVQAR